MIQKILAEFEPDIKSNIFQIFILSVAKPLSDSTFEILVGYIQSVVVIFLK